jgi:hypothetical protein
MDSTFMGMLVSIQKRVSHLDGRLWISNPSSEVIRLMDMIGISELLNVQSYQAEQGLEFEELDLCTHQINNRERMHFIRSAHEALMEADERNKKRFGSFLHTLQKEIVKSENKLMTDSDYVDAKPES